MSTPKSFKSKLLVSAVAIAATGGLVAYDATNSRAGTQSKPEVDVVLVQKKSITDWQSYSGRLAAIDKVDVRPLVPGEILSVKIHDGALVKKGDALFVIDPRPYKAEVARTAGKLAAAQARAEYARHESERAQRLMADKAIAGRDYDERKNADREASANLLVARAELEAAQINLGYTRIVAPISGRVSRAEMTLGNIVTTSPGAPPLTTIVSVSPIYAEVDVDEQTYLQNLRQVRNGQKVPVELGLANETGYSRRGSIQSVDNRLNTSSGTIRVRAAFNNDDASLLPGLFARIRIGGSQEHPALLINDGAIGTDQDKKFLYVADKEDRIEYRKVTLGVLQGSLREIKSGLVPGDRVVVNGMQRVRPGDKVRVQASTMQDGSAKAAASN